MSTPMKVLAGGVALFVLLAILDWWVLAFLVLGALALPVVGYMMLDPSQRRRLRAQGRKRLGS